LAHFGDDGGMALDGVLAARTALGDVVHDANDAGDYFSANLAQAGSSVEPGAGHQFWFWSAPAKATNTTGFVLAILSGSVVPAMVIAVAQFAMKVWSARRVLLLRPPVP
jgi:hypothetical protein